MAYQLLKMSNQLAHDSSLIKLVLQQKQKLYNNSQKKSKTYWSETMKIITSENFQQEQTTSEVDRNEAIDQVVLDVIRNVRANQDQALYSYGKQFDHVDLDQLIVSEKEMKTAYDQVSDSFIE